MLTSKCRGVPNITDRIAGDLNVSINQSYQSPLGSQPKLPIRDIQRYYGWTCIHAGSDKSAAYERTWVFQKASRRLHNYE